MDGSSVPYSSFFGRSPALKGPPPPVPFLMEPLSQLSLPPEFVAQQAQKLMRQQLEQQHQKQQQHQQHHPEQEEKMSRPGTGVVLQQLLFPPSSPPLPQPTSPLKSPSHPHHVKYVPAEVPDLAYNNRKLRDAAILAHLKKAAGAERTASVQLEMRGSVRFDMSNPQAIFAVAKAQAEKPILNDDFNEKHEVRLKDGTITTVFGRIHEKSDTVKAESLSQFFVGRDSPNAAQVTLDHFSSTNYQKDLQKHSRRNHANSTMERKSRIDRTDDELLTCSDEVLTPLERWKRDQLRQKLAKQQAEENELKEQRARQNELLKLRLEKERFEREEREKWEKEEEERLAKEEEERQFKEAERQRQYRELVILQAEETKAARLAEEERKKREEEEELKRQADEAKRRRQGGGDFNFMKPISSKVAQSQQNEILIGRIKDTEKDWAIARAKLKAEMVRIEELLRKRDRAAKRAQGLPLPSEDDFVSASTLKDPTELREAIRRLHRAFVGEKHELKELERQEQEAKSWYEKALQAHESHVEREKEKEREANTPIQRTSTLNSARRTLAQPLNTREVSFAQSTRASKSSDQIEEESADEMRTHLGSPLLPLPSPNRRSGRALDNPRASLRSRDTSNSVSQVGSTNNSRHQSPIHSPGQSRRATAEKGQQLLYQQEDDNSPNGANPNDEQESVTNFVPSDGIAPGDGVNPSSSSVDVRSRSLDEDDDFSTPIVNERTLAIDAARAQMMNEQAEFEARIKMLTTFAPSSSSASASKKKGNTKRATASNKDMLSVRASMRSSTSSSLTSSAASSPAASTTSLRTPTNGKKEEKTLPNIAITEE